MKFGSTPQAVCHTKGLWRRGSGSRPNQWELRPLRRRSRMKPGQFRYTSWITSPYMPRAHTAAACGRDISTKQCHPKLLEAEPDMPKMYRHGGFFLCYPWCAPAYLRPLKPKSIHGYPFRCAQFSARWFSRGQGILLRPYCRMAKILRQPARKAAAENHIVFGSRRLQHMAAIGLCSKPKYPSRLRLL